MPISGAADIAGHTYSRGECQRIGYYSSGYLLVDVREAGCKFLVLEAIYVIRDIAAVTLQLSVHVMFCLILPPFYPDTELLRVRQVQRRESLVRQVLHTVPSWHSTKHSVYASLSRSAG
jgi:hypothetical protein